ncbi:TonB-dependent receptor [Haloferula helveola]|uniref:TonB-dependent receptor n=1 Tax=Haloferula helveola TaxID=490095 RepID=A0ABM7RF22_9BACT|nr:TonB-dependent receptor [Haloferula helveola]
MFRGSLLLALGTLAAAEELPETVVLAERDGSAPGSLAFWDETEISSFAPRTIDELLATDPSFSLYRPQSAIFANPTAAGVSLRNTGATAASRTLVLRDGIPQNDPFGGWVHWARFDPWALESVRIAPASRSAAWGNLSPAGSIRLNRRPIDQNRAMLRLTAGSHGTYGGSVAANLVSDDTRLGFSFLGFTTHSDGFQTVPASQRGAIDRRLGLDFSGFDLRAVWRPTDHLTVEPALSFYDERRGNGTPVTGNTTEAFDASVRITSEDGPLSWQLLGYYQRRRFASVFSSIDSLRSTERVALNQFDVPGEGVGGAFVIRRETGDTSAVTVGADLRLLRGETNEDAGTFRRRKAGGSQNLAGIFATGEWQPRAGTRLDASLRLDRWELRDGKRIERSLTSGALLRSGFSPNREGWEPSAALSIRHDLTRRLTGHAAISTSYRLPTLNELHRPFRVRNDLTEANPNLDPERFYSIEAGLEWRPNDCFTLEASVFHHWVRDAIANVPVTDPAEIAAIFGSLPPGGTGAQRANVDEARILGLQTSAEWRPDDFWTVRFDGLWSDTEFSSSRNQPLLEDKPFPFAPDLRLIGSLTARPSDTVSVFAGIEYGSSRFDDALASRRIPSYYTCRIGGTWQATDSLSVHARVENLLDAEIVTGLGSDGIRGTGQPRSFWITAELGF